jgi:N-acetylmuramoyl-L-alanine amidase
MRHPSAVKPISAKRLGLFGLALGLSAAILPMSTISWGFAQAKGFLGARAAVNQAQANQAIASAAEFADLGDTASLDLTLSAPVEASAFVLSDPDRVIIDLPAVAFKVEPPALVKQAPQSRHSLNTPAPKLIQSLRFGSFAPGRSRIVIDLAGPARVMRTEVSKIGDQDGYRLSIQLAKTDRASFRTAAQTVRSSMALAAISEPVAPEDNAPKSSAALPRIVIDPGHGGVDSGAMTGGLIEKTVVLDFAKTLAAKLTATGRYTVVMTRDDDTFISLGDRVKVARDGNAALFVSIHADTLSEADVTGATVYTVSDKASDVQAARVAEKENQSDAAAGVEGKEDVSGVSDILFDLTRRETRAYSHVFSHTLANYWKVAARLNKNPERSAGFRVLTAPDVPSVLLELGYLSNEKDASALNSSDWRDKTTSQITNAIETFFAARGKGSVEAKDESPLLLKPSSSPDITAAALVSDAKPVETARSVSASH